MFVKNIALAVLLVGSVYAQNSSDGSGPTDTSSSPLPTSSIPPCVLTCAQSSTLCTFTDASCACFNVQYQLAVLLCLDNQCTAADVQQGKAIEAALCSAASAVSSITSKVSSVQSSASIVLSSLSKFPTPTGTGSTSNGSGGATGPSASTLATVCAVLLGVIGGGMLVF